MSLSTISTLKLLVTKLSPPKLATDALWLAVPKLDELQVRNCPSLSKNFCSNGRHAILEDLMYIRNHVF